MKTRLRTATAAETAPGDPPGAKRTLAADVFAGLTVAGVLLPEAVAYASIAGVPAMHALLAALVGLCIYPLIGTSRFAIVAPTSSAAAIFATASSPDMGYALVALTGGLFLAAGKFHAGFLGAYISRPVLRGFAWGLAITIILKQVPHIAGIHAPGENAVRAVIALWELAGSFHRPSVLLGCGALLLWLFLHHVLQRVVFIPQSLIVLALGIALSFRFTLDALGVALVGQIEWQPLALHIPDIATSQWLRAAEIAPALLLILFAESWGSVRSLALQTGDSVDANREMLAFGAANLAGALLQGIPVGAGFSAASANFSAGGRSKWTGFAAAVVLAALLWQARSWLALLPLPVLAAVVVGILSHNLWPRAVIAGLRQGGDAWLAIAAAAGVLVFGVLFGMLFAVGSSLLLAIRHFAQPLVTELGRLPDTRDYLDCERHPEVIRLPGILIVRTEEPLFFANAEQVFQAIQQRVAGTRPDTVVLSLEVCNTLDATAAEALSEFVTLLRRHGKKIILARVKDPVREAMARAGLISLQNEGLPLYWSVDDAVQAASMLSAPAKPPVSG